jgi:uncharacterized DUF497 family protein
MRYDFEWDPQKANVNLSKHKISFERSASIFRDPNILSIHDTEHSQFEERWLTMGLDENGILLVLSHTFEYIDSAICKLRIISARKATKAETKQYEKGI